MKIGFDLDNCIGDLDAAFYPAAQKLGYLVGCSPEQSTNYSFSAAFPQHITDEQVCEVLDQPGFFSSLPVVPELRKAVELALEVGDEVHVVTARWDIRREETLQWLIQNKLGDQVVLVHKPSREKHLYAVEKQLELFVEDRFDTAVRIAKAGIPVLLVAYPYNDPSLFEEELPGNLHRLSKEEILSRFLRRALPKLDPEVYGRPSLVW